MPGRCDDLGSVEGEDRLDVDLGIEDFAVAGNDVYDEERADEVDSSMRGRTPVMRPIVDG